MQKNNKATKTNPQPLLAGIMRLDTLGRVVIPKPICKMYGIGYKSILNITMEGDGMTLEKHTKGVSRYDKRIGLARALDSLDRITLPKEMRDEFDLDAPQEVYVVFDNNEIVIKKLSRTSE